MRTVYIDYTTSVPDAKHVFHGGANYTKELLLFLKRKNITGNRYILLYPAGYEPKSSIEIEFFTSGFFELMPVQNLTPDFPFDKNSMLLLPLLYRPRDYGMVEKIKKKHNTVKVYAVIHDLRNQHNRYDHISRYLHTGWRYYFYFIRKPGKWLQITFLDSQKIKSGIRSLDKIITSSNYSLKSISKYQMNGTISLNYMTVLPRGSKFESGKERYMLFVSGNRPDKNLLRTLEAFCIYAKKGGTGYYLYVTGVEQDLLERLLRYKKLDASIIRKWVKPLGYVTDEELGSLYNNCAFLLFTSKYEGFGLPLLEAAMYGRPGVSSFSTSIPEVLGSCSHYVNPYDANSIAQGIAYMTKSDNLQMYEERLKTAVPIIKAKMELDRQVLIQELFPSS